jgi:hypothetical protein
MANEAQVNGSSLAFANCGVLGLVIMAMPVLLE